MLTPFMPPFSALGPGLPCPGLPCQGLALPALGFTDLKFPALGFPALGFSAVGFPALGFPRLSFSAARLPCLTPRLTSPHQDPVLFGCHRTPHAPYRPKNLLWLTRDAAARLAIRNHLPLAECAQLGQHRTAQTLYDAVVARYSSPATAAPGRLLLPYLFPELSAFATIEDLHLLAAETSAVPIGAACGTPRTPFFEGCSPSPLAPSYASAAAVDVLSTEDVGAASASANHRRSKCKGGRGGGGGSGSGGGGSNGGSGGSGGGGSGGSGGGSGGVGGDGGGSGGSGGSGSGGSGGSRSGAQRGGIDAASLGASVSVLPGTAPAEALDTWTQVPHVVSFVTAPISLLSLHLFRSDWLTPPRALSFPVPPLSSRVRRTAALQDAMVTTTTPGGQRVSICTCTRTGPHLATFTRRPGSSLYTLATEPPQVVASAQGSASGLFLPSRPRLPRPAFLASRGGSVPLLTPPRFPRQLPPCRLSTWTCGAQPASMEAAGVADTAATTRATDAVAADSTASTTIVTRTDICGVIATSSLMDGPLLKAKRVEEQEEGEEEAVEAVAVAEVVPQVPLHSLDYWVIDSGATYSMTPRADLLTELEPSPVKHVTSALGQRAEVKGMGKAMFKGVDGKMVGLKNVLWVPNLAANLISVRRLQKAGMDTTSKGAKTYTARLGERILWDLHEDRDGYNEMWQIPVVPMPKKRQVAVSISTRGEAVGRGDGANGRAKEIDSKNCNLGGTSKLSENEESGAAAQKQNKDEENPKAAAGEEYGESMWGTIASAAFSNPTSATGECDWLTLHWRMGHVALPILQQLVKNEMVAGIRVKGEPDEVLGCPTCMQAKFNRYSFYSSEAMAKAPLDEVVMDVVGPLKLGAAGAEYFLNIVNVYTRMTWVYVLSKKSDVAETVKIDWLPMVERQQDRLVKAIRTDRGGEFLSKEFSLWLKKNGIRHSLTMPYSPAMNGIAERANRTITETARGLLIEAGLHDYFWPDAVRSACVAKNRAFTHVGADKWVPYVEWIGRKPQVDMLRVFGCMCMALVPKHLRHNKLGAKAIWAVHLGMAQNSKGWLLWDPFTKKFLVRRDCKFMENLMYKDWKEENEAKIGMRFGEVKSSGLEHVELPLELSSGSTTTRQSSLVNGGEEAKDAEEEEEEVQQVSERAPTLPSRTTSAPRIRVTPQQRQGLHVPAAEEEGRGKRRIQDPNRLTYDALGKPAKSALAGAALMVGDDEESDYEECAFTFFSLVEMPEGRKAITSKWLFKIKSDADGKIERYKSRLVAKGYQQKEKKDYKELYSPVVKPTTLRTLLVGAAIKGWVVKQMDVITAFLNGVLEEEIFMAQPEGFDDGSGRVLKLKKALYGLKLAPRQWYLKLRGVLEEIGFTPSTADHSLFMLGQGEQRSFMVVYVDEILFFSPFSDLVKEVMQKLQDKFKCKALGDVSFHLGLHIERDVEKRCMRVHQRKYLEALAANFGQSEGHVATPFPSGLKYLKGQEEESVGEEERRRFHSLVGSLMYAAVNTRTDVAFATGQLARIVQCPNKEQVAAGMRVAKYLGQTPTVGLQYSVEA
ncbi:unnamed protein product [Closterium sp. NIES-54]